MLIMASLNNKEVIKCGICCHCFSLWLSNASE